jgi:diguanylate cyclase (GGDEF)-like protein
MVDYETDHYGVIGTLMTIVRASPLRLSIAIVVVISVLTALVASGEAAIVSRGFAAERYVRDAMIANQRLLRLQLDEEDGLRGFESTGERLFLEPYTAARISFPQTLAALRSDVATSGVVTSLPDDLRRRNAAWLADVAGPLLAARGDRRALERRGKIQIDAFRRISLQLLGVLKARAEQIDAEARRNIALIIVFAGIVSAVTTGAAAGLFLREGARRRANEARLAERAERDPLTGLLNRAAFAAALDVCIDACRADGSVFALAFVDLDGFKSINDRYGHQVGDAVLKRVADRLAANARERDVVARLGGDEFVVMLVGGGDGSHAIARIAAALAAPHGLGDVTLTIDASIGRAVYPADGADAESLLHAADLAMYRNKRERSGLHVLRV